MIKRGVLRCSVFQITEQTTGERVTVLCLFADRAQSSEAHKRPGQSPIFAWSKQNHQNPWLRRPPVQPGTANFQCRNYTSHDKPVSLVRLLSNNETNTSISHTHTSKNLLSPCTK